MNVISRFAMDPTPLTASALDSKVDLGIDSILTRTKRNAKPTGTNVLVKRRLDQADMRLHCDLTVQCALCTKILIRISTIADLWSGWAHQDISAAIVLPSIMTTREGEQSDPSSMTRKDGDQADRTCQGPRY